MCGIAGIIDPESTSENINHQLLKMLAKTNHRGPDFTGHWVDKHTGLGHNRLKIIDLSDHANQPFEYKNCLITFNGEVYNYIEIRDILKKNGFAFETQSDTEVIIAAYIYWGKECVNHFVGMWAFAIWDKEKNELFCSRDRFGIKPFYFIHHGNKFFFSSEYKPLKTLPIFDNKLNLNQVNRGIELGWACYKDETYFEQIKSLESSHNLIFKNGKISTFKYWDLNSEKRQNLNFNQTKDEFYSLFENSIKIHSRSDVSIGACLSGGLDSSAITSMFCNQNPNTKLNTFTIYYEGEQNVDERPFVYDVLKKYGNIEAKYFTPNNDDINIGYEKATYHADIPLLGSSYISQYFLMNLAAKNNIKVLLDGQGSDEYLLGYLHSFNRMIGQSLNQFQIIGALKTLLSHKKQHELTLKDSLTVLLKGIYSSLNTEQDVYSHEFKKLSKYLNDSNLKSLPLSIENKFSNKIDNFSYHMLFTTSLPSLLYFEDRNSMAHSIESRVPFLDHRLVEFVFSLPNSFKINDQAQTKYILRKSLNNILPETIANRKDKKGFVTPGEVLWLNGPLKNLLEIDYNHFHWLNKSLLKEEIENYKKGDFSNSKFVWRIASLNYWLKNNTN